ncbi:MAG: imidazole glycerol phosphate synthase subunit HisH, partial [Thermoleophilia bacterium]
MGNLASVAKALERSGADVRITQSPAAVRGAAAVVLPGVGAFRDAAARL